jgi:preprotein translocase subunit SecA
MPAKKSPAGPGKSERLKAATVANPVRAEDVAQPPKPPKAGSAEPSTPARLPFRRPPPVNFAGVGRNDICPCGSGKRFKNCHGH